MDESDFEGTLVLEQLAEIGAVEDFFDAIDSDDVQRAASLMKRAKIDTATIAIVVKRSRTATPNTERAGATGRDTQTETPRACGASASAT